MCQDKAQRAGNGPGPCQAVQRRPGASRGLPSGEPLTGHLRRCACLKGGLPFLRKRVLHLTGQRLAGRVEIYGSRYWLNET